MEATVLHENFSADSLQDKAAYDKKMTKESKLEKSSNPADVADESEVNERCESTAVAKQKAVKNRKKSDCNVQHVLRALNSLSTPEEKLAAMCQKYADLFDDNRKLQGNMKQFEKQLTTVTKEKDQFRSDLSKSILSRSRLENLCRELQRQNKEIKEESFQKIREEEEKRKEVSAKFQTTLNEITELMKEDNDKTMKLRDDNIDMTSKLKSIYEQYGIREQQIEKMAKQMALESQLYEARLAKMEMETSAEKEILLREKQQLLVTLTEYQAKFQEYQNIEVALRNQVALYNSKYEEFEKSLTRSNKVFGGFKEEMESMSYKIVKLESETQAWKQRWEKTQKALLEMAAEKQKSDQEVILAAKQMATLHKLCRTLQVERTQLLSKLKELGSAPETDKFVAALENVFAEKKLSPSEDAKENELVSPPCEHEEKSDKRNANNQCRKKSKQKKPISSQGSSMTTEDSSNIVAADDDQALAELSSLSLDAPVEPITVLEKHLQETSLIDKKVQQCKLKGDLTHSENVLDPDPFVLKKSTHSSKAKISPKKKCKK